MSCFFRIACKVRHTSAWSSTHCMAWFDVFRVVAFRFRLDRFREQAFWLPAKLALGVYIRMMHPPLASAALSRLRACRLTFIAAAIPHAGFESPDPVNGLPRYPLTFDHCRRASKTLACLVTRTGFSQGAAKMARAMTCLLLQDIGAASEGSPMGFRCRIGWSPARECEDTFCSGNSGGWRGLFGCKGAVIVCDRRESSGRRIA